MYVAITRARQRLYLSLAQTRMLHGQTRYNMRSRFLDELPENDVRWLTPRLNAQGAIGGGFVNYEGGSSYGYSSRSANGFTGRGRTHQQSGFGSAAKGPGGGGRAVSLAGHDSGFRIGQNVSHARFGQGVIVALEGSGEDARAQIHFKRDGVKWLALAIAKIEAA